MTKRSNRVQIVLVAFLGTASLLAGCGFLYKLFEFFMSIDDPDILGFAIAPLVNYFLVASGFFALLIWAFLSGQFSDIERAKHDLLRDQEEYDREDAHLEPFRGENGLEEALR